MQRWLPMGLLILGTLFASAFGARNGDTHVAFRQANWAVNEAQAGITREAAIDAMEAAHPKLFDKQPQNLVLADMDDDATRELNDLLTPFGIALNQENVTDSYVTALATTADAWTAHKKRTAELTNTGFLVPTTPKEQRAEAMTVDLTLFIPAAGLERWETVVRKAENFGLGSRKIELSAVADVPTEEDQALMDAIGGAIAGTERVETFAALAARGMPVEAPTDDLVVRELLSGDKRAATMASLTDAGLITLVQSYEDRLVIADAKRTEIGLPNPRQRVAQWFAVAGPIFVFGALFIGIGAIMARRQIAAENAGTATADGDTHRIDFQENLNTVMDRLNALIVDAADIAMDAPNEEVRAEIDSIHLDLLTPAVDQRGRFVARHGIAAFAEYFSPFSAGERNLARAWSAFTDGHSVVARDALQRAHASFTQADVAWKKAESELSSS